MRLFARLFECLPPVAEAEGNFSAAALVSACVQIYRHD